MRAPATKAGRGKARREGEPAAAPRALPGEETMAAIASAIGRDAALKLADKFGGTRIYVPLAIGDHHPLCVALGREIADSLAAYCGGGPLVVPKQAARRERVLELHSRRSLTIAQIALETGYSERHVHRLLSEATDDRQPGLFD